MMRNNLGAFENGLNSDLDLDATQDFVNQAGSFSFTTPSMLGLERKNCPNQKTPRRTLVVKSLALLLRGRSFLDGVGD